MPKATGKTGPLSGGGVPDGSFSGKAKSFKGKPYTDAREGGPNKSNPVAEAEEKGGSKQK